MSSVNWFKVGASFGVAGLLAAKYLRSRQEYDQYIHVDLIAAAHYIVPVEGFDQPVLENHALVVDKGIIVDVLPQSQAVAKYRAKKFINYKHSVLMPGLVNMHTHLGMTFLRGYADDFSLSEWLMHHIWPAEGVFVSPQFVKDGTELGMVEMIRCGTTCANDMYFFTDSLVQAAEGAGLRVSGGLVVMDFPTSYGSGADDYFQKAAQVLQRHKWNQSDANPLIRFTIDPHAPYTVSDANLTRCKEFSETHGVPIHIHLHETKAEVVDSEANNKGSMACHLSDIASRPFHNLDRLGLMNERMIAVHMTQLNDDEIKRCAEAKINVVHCPSSNLKLASGMCPIGKLVEAGANVCLGTDSTASNNTLDMWGEMRTAAILAKAVTSDATAIPALTAIRMATLNGAKALGLQHLIGSLQAGKSADFIAVDLNSVEFTPMFDVLSHIVYVADRHCVTDVWVAGRHLMENRRLLTLDQAMVVQQARNWQKKLQEHKISLASASSTSSPTADNASPPSSPTANEEH